MNKQELYFFTEILGLENKPLMKHNNASKQIIIEERQKGKTTLALGRALYRAYTNIIPEQHIVILTHVETHRKHMMSEVQPLMQSISDNYPKTFAVIDHSDDFLIVDNPAFKSRTGIKFINNIDKLRGHPRPNYIIVDEAAFFARGLFLFDLIEHYKDADILILSTPNGLDNPLGLLTYGEDLPISILKQIIQKERLEGLKNWTIERLLDFLSYVKRNFDIKNSFDMDSFHHNFDL